MNGNLARWSAVGWSVRNHGSRLRLTVHVSRALANPAVPVDRIALPASLGGGFLKPAVEAVHDYLPPRMSAFAGPGELVDGFAPGCRVESPAGRAGIAAFVSDGVDVFAVTCGHTFTSGTALRFNGQQVCELKENLLDDDEPLDAALCRLTDAGVQAARQAGGASTWFRRVHRPTSEDNDRAATVYPTHEGSGLPFAESVVSFSSCSSVGGETLCDLITLRECTVAGDSGTLLAIDDEYYGICRGSTGIHSCFTPIRAAVYRFRDSYPGLRIWIPD